eukprot:3205953-Amphidinium_carterae.1
MIVTLIAIDALLRAFSCQASTGTVTHRPTCYCTTRRVICRLRELECCREALYGPSHLSPLTPQCEVGGLSVVYVACSATESWGRSTVAFEVLYHMFAWLGLSACTLVSFRAQGSSKINLLI